ncbi:hypothetical protein P280DRAFT_483680 [Massarina eburnea CBS 473.64]|uniref:Uncharacterized protein n=1 Tax=Massarina eburnea CBS 473.64 TaxID=1395130 RepID=A0A6A6RML3_9PLEO|nr:hypothetical protein P280DRAFT_483680 [Massarina eburnea CBS 473.64]
MSLAGYTDQLYGEGTAEPSVMYLALMYAGYCKCVAQSKPFGLRFGPRIQQGRRPWVIAAWQQHVRNGLKRALCCSFLPECLDGGAICALRGASFKVLTRRSLSDYPGMADAHGCSERCARLCGSEMFWCCASANEVVDKCIDAGRAQFGIAASSTHEKNIRDTWPDSCASRISHLVIVLTRSLRRSVVTRRGAGRGKKAANRRSWAEE